MKMIAIGTVHGKKVSREPDRKVKGDKGDSVDVVVKPGAEFDTKELGISDAEADQLVKSGAARRKTKEVADDSERVGVQGAGAGASSGAGGGEGRK